MSKRAHSVSKRPLGRFLVLGVVSLWPIYSAAGTAFTFSGNENNKIIYVCPPCKSKCDLVEFEKPGVCPHCKMKLVDKTTLETPIPAKDRIYVCPPCDKDCDKRVHEKAGTCAPCGMTLIAQKKKPAKEE